MGEKTCPNCGAALMPSDIFCGECGVRVQDADYDPDDVPAEAVEEPLDEEQVSAAAPTAGEYVSPPPTEAKKGEWTTLRVIAVVVAVGFLLVSLCLCSLGGLMLIPSDSTSAEEVLLIAAICFAPGMILGLLGVGAAYFGFRK